MRELAGLVDGTMSAAERERLRRHLAACEHCGTLWTYLVEVVEGDEATAREETPGSTGVREEAPGSSEVRERARRRWSRPLAGVGWGTVAAGVALLALATWAYLTPPVTSTGGASWRGGPASLSAEATRIDEESVRVRWERWPAADAYRVRVWSASEGLVVDERFDRHTTDAILALPRGGEARHWSVEALTDGRVEAASAPRGVLR